MRLLLNWVLSGIAVWIVAHVVPGVYVNGPIAALIAALVIALAAPRLGENWFRAAERRFTRFARRRTLSIITVGLLALVGRAALLPLIPVPEPGAHSRQKSFARAARIPPMNTLEDPVLISNAGTNPQQVTAMPISPARAAGMP